MTENITSTDIKKRLHHDRDSLCTTRPAYRQGRKLTAVKVYTVNEESQHLIIRGVPALNLHKELKHLCMRFGEVKLIHVVANYAEDEEPFTEVYHVLYAKIPAARFAKHMIDDKSFYGGVLHVCYAPELESLSETRQKLMQRTRDVWKRVKNTTHPNEKSAVDMNDAASSSNNINQGASTSAFAYNGLVEQIFIPYNRPNNSASRHKGINLAARSRDELQQTVARSTSNAKRNYATQFLPSTLKKAKLEYKS